MEFLTLKMEATDFFEILAGFLKMNATRLFKDDASYL